jgi:hypothetical protein
MGPDVPSRAWKTFAPLSATMLRDLPGPMTAVVTALKAQLSDLRGIEHYLQTYRTERKRLAAEANDDRKR